MTNPHTTKSHIQGCRFLRIDEDGFGRNEPTIYYEHPEHGSCYVWEKHLTVADRRALGLDNPPLPVMLASTRHGIPFTACLAAASRNQELINQFDRLKGTNLSLSGAPIELAIDTASGRLENDIRSFIEFVWSAVFLRIGLSKGACNESL